jgi:hypothetical protein
MRDFCQTYWGPVAFLAMSTLALGTAIGLGDWSPLAVYAAADAMMVVFALLTVWVDARRSRGR